MTAARRVLRILAKSLTLLLLTSWLLLTLVFGQLKGSVKELEDVYTSQLPPGAGVELKRALGFEQPTVWLEYLVFLRNVLTGEWGISPSRYPRTVREVVAERLPRSLFLLGLALLAAIPLGRALGRLFRHPRLGVAARLGTLGLATTYLPLLALLLAHVFTYRLGWLSLGQTLDPMLWRRYPGASLNGVVGGLLVALTISALLAWIAARLIRQILPQNGRALPPAVGVGIGLFTLGMSTALALLLGVPLQLALDLLRHLGLPWATLTLYVGAWYALLIQGDLVRSPGEGQRTTLPSLAIFLALALSTLLAVEAFYYWLGIGPLIAHALLQMDIPVLLGVFWLLMGLFLGAVFALKAGLELRALRAQVAQEDPEAKWHRRVWRWSFKLSLPVLLAIGLAALLHPLLLGTVWDPTKYDPWQGRDLQPPPPAPPSLEHPLGTDSSGRDVLSGLMAWARSTLSYTVPAGLIALISSVTLGAFVRGLKRRGWVAPASATTALAYAPLVLPFAVFWLALSLGRPLPPWAWAGLLGLPWAFRTLQGSSPLSLPSRGKGAWARRVALLGAAASYGAGASALRLSLALPLGSVIATGPTLTFPPGMLQNPFQYGWTFWPLGLTISLFGLALFALGWALKMRAEA